MKASIRGKNLLQAAAKKKEIEAAAAVVAAAAAAAADASVRVLMEPSIEEYPEESVLNVGGDDEEEALVVVEEEEEELMTGSVEYEAPVAQVPSPEINRGGRPCLEVPDPTDPSWRVAASAVETTAPADQTIGHLMNQLLRICTQHHLTDLAGKDIFDVWRKFLPGTKLPHFRQARQIAETEAPVNVQHFAVCSGDCNLHPLANLSADALKLLRGLTCDKCHTPLVENKAFVKVSRNEALSGSVVDFLSTVLILLFFECGC